MYYLTHTSHILGHMFSRPFKLHGMHARKNAKCKVRKQSETTHLVVDIVPFSTLICSVQMYFYELSQILSRLFSSNSVPCLSLGKQPLKQYTTGPCFIPLKVIVSYGKVLLSKWFR